MTAASLVHESPARPKSGYLTYLDGLRGLAILAVLVFHAGGGLLPGGFIGVDVFFVLSGYLITSLLLKEWQKNGKIDLAHFYMRRVLRLLPALVVMLIVLLVIWYVFAADFREKLIDSLVVLFYEANWIRAFEWPLTPSLGHTWSLSIEEQFYVLWPPLFIGLMAMRLSLPKLGWIAAALALAAAGWRLWLLLNGARPMRLYNGLDTHCDGLLVGCALAFFAAAYADAIHRRAKQFHTATVVSLVFLAAVLAIAKYESPLMLGLGFFLVTLASAVVVLGLQTNENTVFRRLTDWPPMVKLGRISYGVYLWHWPIYAVVGDTYRQLGLPGRAPMKLLIGMTISIGVAALSYWLIEARFLRLKHRFQ